MYFGCYGNFQVSIDLYWDKLKIGIYCYLIADILEKKMIQKCYWVVLYET